MPTLPTLTVTAAQATRLLNAFAGRTDENGNALTPTQAYKRWLRDDLVAYVKNAEVTALQATQTTAIQAALNDAATALAIDPTV